MTTVLRLSGLSCNNCVRHVSDALLALPGVISVDVSQHCATVEHSEITTQQELRNAVSRAGYSAS